MPGGEGQHKHHKPAPYAVMHLTVAVAVAFAISGDLSIGVVEPLVQTGFFAMHERLWEGKRRARETNRDTLVPAA